jgi:metallo-beta-lactamase family protein
MIVPAFAVGRTQEVLYILHELQRKDALPPIPVFVDSPLAIAATEIFRRHPECFDGPARALLRGNDDPLNWPGLTLTRSTEESRAINEKPGAAVVIAASGMANAGRVLHHLKHNLWRPRAHVVFIGYQAQGTIGRKIVDGAKAVRIFREPVAVRAKIHTLGGFSAHADREELLDWVGHFRTPGLKVFVVHGEESSSRALAEGLLERNVSDVRVPGPLESVDLMEPPVAAPKKAAPPAATSDRMLDVERKARRLRKRVQRMPELAPQWDRKLAGQAERLALLLEEMQATLVDAEGKE